MRSLLNATVFQSSESRRVDADYFGHVFLRHPVVAPPQDNPLVWWKLKVIRTEANEGDDFWKFGNMRLSPFSFPVSN
jgi:hypothetical protein